MPLMFHKENRAIVEALLLAASEPLTIAKLSQIMQLNEEDVAELLKDLTISYDQEGRGWQLLQVAAGYQLATRSEHASYIEKLYQPAASGLSRASLETLAIIAYKQPITRSEIEMVRGVKVERTIFTLGDKELITDVGRKEGPGKPILYGTTKEFLQHFGLNSLDDLPPIAEFREQAEQELGDDME